MTARWNLVDFFVFDVIPFHFELLELCSFIDWDLVCLQMSLTSEPSMLFSFFLHCFDIVACVVVAVCLIEVLITLGLSLFISLLFALIGLILSTEHWDEPPSEYEQSVRSAWLIFEIYTVSFLVWKYCLLRFFSASLSVFISCMRVTSEVRIFVCASTLSSIFFPVSRCRDCDCLSLSISLSCFLCLFVKCLIWF